MVSVTCPLLCVVWSDAVSRTQSHPPLSQQQDVTYVCSWGMSDRTGRRPSNRVERPVDFEITWAQETNGSMAALGWKKPKRPENKMQISSITCSIWELSADVDSSSARISLSRSHDSHLNKTLNHSCPCLHLGPRPYTQIPIFIRMTQKAFIKTMSSPFSQSVELDCRTADSTAWSVNLGIF